MKMSKQRAVAASCQHRHLFGGVCFNRGEEASSLLHLFHKRFFPIVSDLVTLAMLGLDEL